MDSGATHTCLSQATYEKIPEDERPALIPTDVRFFSAAKSETPPAKVLGRAYLDMTLTSITGRKVPTTIEAYIIDNLQERVLISETWFKENCTLRTKDRLYIPKDPLQGDVPVALAETLCHQIEIHTRPVSYTHLTLPTKA